MNLRIIKKFNYYLPEIQIKDNSWQVLKLNNIPEDTALYNILYELSRLDHGIGGVNGVILFKWATLLARNYSLKKKYIACLFRSN